MNWVKSKEDFKNKLKRGYIMDIPKSLTKPANHIATSEPEPSYCDDCEFRASDGNNDCCRYWCSLYEPWKKVYRL